MQDEYPEPDDGTAEEQRLREQEREVADDALSAAQDAEDIDPHAEEVAALGGFSLAWWAEEGEHNTPPLDIVVDLTNQACGRTHYMAALEELGLDLTPSTGYIGLNSKTGPLVVAGLQILGTLHSHIRDEVTKVLKQCFDAVPEFPDEFEDEFERVNGMYEQQQIQAAAERMGIQIMTQDELAEQIVADDDQRRDARNN